MPTLKHLHRYPKSYEILFRKAMEEVIKQPCATVRSANAQRRSYYNYREALRLESNDEKLIKLANRLTFAIHGTNLYIYSVDLENEVPIHAARTSFSNSIIK